MPSHVTKIGKKYGLIYMQELASNKPEILVKHLQSILSLRVSYLGTGKWERKVGQQASMSRVQWPQGCHDGGVVSSCFLERLQDSFYGEMMSNEPSHSCHSYRCKVC